MGYWPILCFSNVFSVLGQFWTDFRVFGRFTVSSRFQGFEEILEFILDFWVLTIFLRFMIDFRAILMVYS